MRYNKAPLPFLGQKRNFLKIIRQLDFSNKTVVDLFGGSGLLSHTIKDQYPSAHVIYNDFDNYQSRLDAISTTEKLRIKLFTTCSDIKKSSKIDNELKNNLIGIILDSKCEDWLTLSSWLLFSGNYVQNFEKLIKSTWYCNIPGAPVSCDGYLTDVIRTQGDFRELVDRYNGCNTIFIADPPYIMTDQTGYIGAKNNIRFRLKDAIDCIRSLYDKQTILFSSTKSETCDLLEVWKPRKLEKMIQKSSIGNMRPMEEYVYFINFPQTPVC